MSAKFASGVYITIHPATPEKQQEIVALVDKILAAKETPKQVQCDMVVDDTSGLEKKIDVLVYELYELTAEEIGIIEG